MEAYAYKLTIHNSVLEWTHNMGQRIWEVYIPIIGAVFNEAGGMFLHKGPRDQNAELIPIEVPLDVVTGVEQFIKRQNRMDEVRKQLFTEINEKFKDKA